MFPKITSSRQESSIYNQSQGVSSRSCVNFPQSRPFNQPLRLPPLVPVFNHRGSPLSTVTEETQTTQESTDESELEQSLDRESVLKKEKINSWINTAILEKDESNLQSWLSLPEIELSEKLIAFWRFLDLVSYQSIDDIHKWKPILDVFSTHLEFEKILISEKNIIAYYARKGALNVVELLFGFRDLYSKLSIDSKKDPLTEVFKELKKDSLSEKQKEKLTGCATCLLRYYNTKRSVLHEKLIEQIESLNENACRIILDYLGRRIDQIRSRSDGSSLLMLYAQREKIDCVNLLIKLGSDVNAENKKGQTASNCVEDEMKRRISTGESTRNLIEVNAILSQHSALKAIKDSICL